VPWQEALDEQLLHKILPKLKGADERTTVVLAWLAEHLDGQFPLSHAKMSAMLDAVRRYGFTSYFQS
jgi:hypothetical protein